jgi:hypothetical protein
MRAKIKLALKTPRATERRINKPMLKIERIRDFIERLEVRL